MDKIIGSGGTMTDQVIEVPDKQIIGFVYQILKKYLTRIRNCSEKNRKTKNHHIHTHKDKFQL